jgi:hypothetical protein
MAKIIRNPLVDGISGKMGNIVFRQRRDGTTVISAAPIPGKRKFSEKQLAQQNRFKEAGEYASQAAAAVPLYAELAEETGKSAYQIALSDRLNAPEIRGVERQPGRIVLLATDDVRVTKVYVTLSNEDGITLEQGQAVPVHDACWEYETDVPGNVLVQAFDLAGNVTSYEA